MNNHSLQPLLDLLSGKLGWLPTALAWIGALRLPMKLAGDWLQRALTAFVNDVANSPESDDDSALRKILGSLPYRLSAFALDAIFSLKLPTTQSLNKHINNIGLQPGDSTTTK